jgi:hypothetical protein
VSYLLQREAHGVPQGVIRPAKESRRPRWQQFDVQSLVIDCETDFRDNEVEFGGHDALDERRPIVHRQIYSKSRVPSDQSSYGRAYGNVCRIGTGTDPYHSRLQLKHLLQAARYGANMDEQRSGFSDEAFADWGGLHASSVAIEQPCPDRFFKRLNAARQSRLRQAHGRGSPREVAM